MNDLYLAIIDALNQKYGSKEMPGWMFVLAAIISIVSAFHAKEIAKSFKNFIAEKDSELVKSILHAKLFSQDEHSTTEYNGILTRNNRDNYSVVIQVIREGKPKVIADATRNSLDEIEIFLRSKTKFILADFK
ncbi:MAG: hypothetical protein IPF65_04440 [Polaromonas sp.]|nr:hypothetical protein [Polaromonas sp.]